MADAPAPPASMAPLLAGGGARPPPAAVAAQLRALVTHARSHHQATRRFLVERAKDAVAVVTRSLAELHEISTMVGDTAAVVPGLHEFADVLREFDTQSHSVLDELKTRPMSRKVLVELHHCQRKRYRTKTTRIASLFPPLPDRDQNLSIAPPSRRSVCRRGHNLPIAPPSHHFLPHRGHKTGEAVPLPHCSGLRRRGRDPRLPRHQDLQRVPHGHANELVPTTTAILHIAAAPSPAPAAAPATATTTTPIPWAATAVVLRAHMAACRCAQSTRPFLRNSRSPTSASY
ncbi:hypothetical protein GGF31_002463 [Allomyces arbusculus]|nr:hypothetical protein GGF31_002463 [Allomyces arbusculus]